MRFILACTFFLIASSTLLAQPGSNDPTFNTNDLGNYVGDGPNNYVNVSLVQPDGKILIGGLFNTYNGAVLPNSMYFSRICRLNTDGSLDESFNHSVTTSLPAEVEDIALQADGKIMIAGGGRYTRLLATGQEDTTFTPGSSTSVKYHSVAIQPDGMILVAGEDIFSGNGIVIRIDENGLPDLTYTPNLGIDGIFKITTLANGTSLIGGEFSAGLRHLLADGTIDQSFANNLSLNCVVYDIEIQSDNKIIVVGAGINRIKRLNSNGTTDNTFVQPSMNGYVKTCDIDGAGNLIIGGNFTTVSSLPIKYIAKLSPTGVTDVSFQSDRYASLITCISIQADQKIVVCTGTLSNMFQDKVRNADRLNSDGSYDFTFNPVSGANASVNCVKEDNQGNIFIGGLFTRFNNQLRGRIAKLLPSGSLDSSFDCFFDGEVYDIEVQNDGKILVGGNFLKANGQNVFRLARLNADGTLDNSFFTGGFNSHVLDIEIQTDGKILVAGEFSQYNSTLQYGLVRLNVDGTLDPTFIQTTSNFYRETHALLDGRVYVNVNGVPDSFHRVLSDGTTDNSFAPFSGFSSLQRSFILPNGEVLIQKAVSDSIFHLDAYGIVINSFHTIGKAILLQTDGKIICARSIGSAEPLIRYFLNGNIDTTFHVHNNLNEEIAVTGAFEQMDGKLLFSGTFGMFDDEGRNRITRCLNCSPVVTHDTVISCNPYTWTENNQTYTTSGIYNHVYPNITVGGCDSIMVLHYTNLSTSSSANETHCNSYVWPQTSQEYFVSGIYSDTLLNGNGCDSIIYLNLTILNQTSGIDIQTMCESFTWIDGNTYTSSTNTPTFTLTNSQGCDSIVTLNLTIVPSIPTVIENMFSMPSDANNCLGEFAVDISGNTDFELDIDNGSQTATTNGYQLFTGLCAGVHDLQIINFCGDTTEIQFVIPVDSNYVFNNPFIDSLAQDSLGMTIENCDIYYDGIDTAYIDSIWANGNTVNVIWNIIDSNGSNFDTTSYELNNGNGVYWLQLSVFCPTKALGDYFAVTEAIYFEDGNISTAGISENYIDNFVLYPNPTNDLVAISFEGSVAACRIYDTQGKLVQNSTITSGGTISLRDVQSGVYFFELITENGKTMKRVVKD